jgi:ferritin-like metal-binding protein YciE
MDDKNKKTIADYVGDMVALEEHIESALDHQLDLAKDDPTALQAIRGWHAMVKEQRDRMRELQTELDAGTAGNPIKKVGSTILGMAAGIIDKVRTEGISKAIRDDYTAFNLAAIGYTMLHTTALSLGDERVAGIAERNLRGYAGAIQRINHIIPDVVINELVKDGHNANTAAADQTRSIVDEAWRETADHSGSSSI